MSILKKLILVSTPIAFAMALSTPVSAQTYSGTFTRPAGEVGCPSGYSTRAPGMNTARTTNQCFPNRSDAPTVAYRGSSTGACPSGFRPDNAGSKWCTSGPSMTYNPESEAKQANIRKPRPNMRCPTGWTSTENRNECWTSLANAPRSRLSNGRPCASGELNDWGMWCTSNYEHLTFREAENAGVADSNIVWTMYQDVDGAIFSPQAKPFFQAKENAGRQPAPSSTASNASRSAAPAAPARTGSMSPQRRSQSSLNTCPNGWFQGMAGQRELPDPNMCYPGPGATPIYSVASLDAPCSEGYWNSMAWCVGMPGTTVPAQSANQQAGPVSPTCPAPTTASAAGQALGGLLGGRRGNSQAGAALGGLLGQVAGSAARPAGC
jgi:hypothetical protein